MHLLIIMKEHLVEQLVKVKSTKTKLPLRMQISLLLDDLLIEIWPVISKCKNEKKKNTSLSHCTWNCSKRPEKPAVVYLS